MIDPKASRNSFYNKHRRNPESRKFYNSAAWKTCRLSYLREHPICERCQRVTADHVHHVIPLDQCSQDQKTDHVNLKALCQPCHNTVEAQTPEPQPVTATGTLSLTEDDQYFYDSEAAERPIRFIQKFCRHFEGRWAGQVFTLLPWQADTVRKLFGWKSRTTGLRRFRELYLLTAKGSGKTPLLAAIGLYMLLGDGEAGAHVVSMASSFEQANLTFDSAKKYIGESPDLARHPGIIRKQYIIDAPKYAKWTTISGKPNGRSGPRPSCIIADEAHEWPSATGIGFDLLCANLFKRSQPLLLIATNAGADRNCYAWSLHERATGVLAGTVDDKTLLPVIHEAPKELDWRSEDAARAANPSIPDIVQFEQIKPEQSKGEARYRRLYLSQWVTGADKWLDMDRWQAGIAPLDREAIKGAPRFAGLDLSAGDDLCAWIDVYSTSGAFQVDSRYWLPKATAERYEARDLIPYSDWSELAAITLLDEPTISGAVQARFAAEIIAEHQRHPITTVCYDRAYSGDVIPALEAAGIVCVKVAQGWSVSAGCVELDRRLIEGTIKIAPNPVTDFCASNVEVTHNNHGQYWPVKPHARGKYAGKRAAKIDGIAALVTALTVAKEHQHKPTPYVGATAINLDLD